MGLMSKPKPYNCETQCNQCGGDLEDAYAVMELKDSNNCLLRLMKFHFTCWFEHEDSIRNFIKTQRR